MEKVKKKKCNSLNKFAKDKFGGLISPDFKSLVWSYKIMTRWYNVDK